MCGVDAVNEKHYIRVRYSTYVEKSPYVCVILETLLSVQTLQAACKISYRVHGENSANSGCYLAIYRNDGNSGHCSKQRMSADNSRQSPDRLQMLPLLLLVWMQATR